MNRGGLNRLSTSEEISMKRILRPLVMVILFLPLMVGITPIPAASGAANLSIYWLPFGEAVNYAKESNKLIFAFVYTDWCSVCKRMDNITLSDANIQSYLSEYFVCTRINAESTREHECNGQRYTEQEIAQILDVDGYPTFVILASRGGGSLGKFSGYRGPNELQEVLTYFGERHFLEMPLDQWRKRR
jgi:thioredoxin-related protein